MIKNNTCDDCGKTPVLESDVGFKGQTLLFCKSCKDKYRGKLKTSDNIVKSLK